MNAGEEIRSQLGSLGGRKAIILGVGNSLKGDDGAGPRVCELLRGETSAEVIDAGTVPENYIQKIVGKGPEVLLVVDAVDFGGQAGALRVLRPEQLDSVVISTHTLSPRVFVDMICGQIDVGVYFIGVQPAQVGLGEEMSGAVADSVNELADILAEIFAVQ